MNNDQKQSTSLNLKALKIEHLVVCFCIIVSTLASFDVALSLGTPGEYYLENRTDPLVFRAAGELLSEGRSPYSLDNIVANITRQRFAGDSPPSITSVPFPSSSLDYFTVQAMIRLQGEEAITAIPFSYPPNSLPLFHLRAVGEPELNAAMLTAVTVLLSMCCLALLVYRYVENPISRQVILLTAILWNPALLDLLLTQTGHLVAFLVFSIVLCHDKRPIVAGIALGLLAFKPHYAIPLGLVALSRQNWQLLWSASFTFLSTSLFSSLLYGWDTWPQFFQNASALNITLFHMESWQGIAAIMMPESIETIGQLGIPVYGASMLLLGVVLFKLGPQLDLLGATSLAILITVIFSPNTHPYDMTMFLIPVIYFTRQFGTKLWFAVITLLIFIRPNVLVEISVTRFCFLVICLLLFIWILQKDFKLFSRNMLRRPGLS